jgi:hypothetical protein
MYNLILILLIFILIYYIFFSKESFTGFRRFGGLTEWVNNDNLFPYIFVSNKKNNNKLNKKCIN